jgi:hypothetical protein
VYPQTLDEWEDGFRRDANPEREIALWCHMARVYWRATEGKALDHEAKRAYFRVILSCANAPREQVLRVTELGAISHDEAQEIVELFYGAFEPS